MLVIWEVVVRALGLRSAVLPPPSRVFLEVLNEANQLKQHAWITATESLEGCAIALVAGTALALLDGFSRRARAITSPVLSLLQRLPLITLAPLMVAWAGFSVAPAVALTTLVCIPPLAVNLRAGIESVPRELLDILEALGAPPARKTCKIRIPWCLPFLSNGIKLSIPLALSAATVAEFVGSNAGLGYMIYYGATRTETAPLLASLSVLALMALVPYALIRVIELRWISWGESVPAVSGVCHFDKQFFRARTGLE